jgi:hypothetical protein
MGQGVEDNRNWHAGQPISLASWTGYYRTVTPETKVDRCYYSVNCCYEADTHIRTHKHTDTSMHTHTLAPHTYTNTYIHTHTYTHTHMHTHTDRRTNTHSPAGSDHRNPLHLLFHGEKVS